MLMRFASGLVALVFGVCGPVSAQTQPVETQLRMNATLQDALIWTGNYEGLSDGALGQRSITAMADFQRAIGQAATGDLAAEQKLQLLKAANEQRQRLGFRLVEVPQVGFNVALPTALVTWKNNKANGSRYSSSDGKIEIVVSKFLASEQPIRGLYDGLLSSPAMRPVTMRVFRSDAFFVAGENENEDYYFTARLEDGVIKGLAITTPRARRPELTRVIIGTANAFHKTMQDYSAAAMLIADSRPQAPNVYGYQKRVEPETRAVSPQQAPQQPAPPKPAAPELANTGSGFFVDRLGHILTNNHVVAECSSIITKGHGTAQIVRRDPSNDLALIKVAPAAVAPARFRDEELELGERIYVAGYPLFGRLGVSMNFTQGLVSSVMGLRNDSRYLQISAAVQPGNSGGPTIEQSGRIAGVVTMKLDQLQELKKSGTIPENVAFSLRPSYALAFLRGARVTPIVDADSRPRSEKDIAKEADGFTVLIGCIN